jgi:uncharacterized protein
VRILGRRSASARGTRLLFATDIHGSDQCFRKFLNAAPVYRTPVLILGGDITGKLLVPVNRHADGTYSCAYNDNEFRALDERGKDEISTLIRRSGHYPVVASPAELEGLNDPVRMNEIFKEVVYKAIEDWVTLADERLKGTGMRMFMAPGNDDFLEIDSALMGSEAVEFAEGQRLWIDDRHEMITTGYSNPTPWDTERELPEPELRALLDEMTGQVESRENLIAVIHPPPYASGLDDAPKLGEDMQVRMQAGAGVIKEPVGSTAVREYIDDVQPLLSLHGHVHESNGAVTLGRTVAINPGSSYTEGSLQAAIVEVGDGVVLSHQLVTG